MEEVRVQDRLGFDQPVPRSVGPRSVMDPQKAQDAPVEQNNDKQGKIDGSDAAVLSQSLQKEFTRGSAGTKVKFTVGSNGESANGEIKFQVVDKASGKVVRTFPSEEIEKVIKATNSASGSGVLVDETV